MEKKRRVSFFSINFISFNLHTVFYVKIFCIFSIPGGKQLTDEEKGKIAVYQEGLSNCKISRRLNRASTGIDNFINLGSHYGSAKRTGRAFLIKNRTKTEIKRFAVQENLSAKEIIEVMDLKVGVRSVQQILKHNVSHCYDKGVGKPELLSRHKMARF